MKPNQNLFTKISEPVDENLCFVLMPFRPEMEEIYEDIIQPTIKELGLECKLAKEIFT
ncbi:MAG: hypothetical protein U9R10_00025 [Euryarchaeota archaeon]|nr:hypothetical protein [Euryarchaeota archaeon]